MQTRRLQICPSSPEGGQRWPYQILLRETDTQIGQIEAAPSGNQWEIHCRIEPPYRQNGYAEEAVQAFTPAILKQLGLKELYGSCSEDNQAGCRMLERCGYKQMENEQNISRYRFTLPEKIIIRREEGKDWFASEWMVKQAFYNLHVPGCNEHLYLHKLRRDPVYIPELAYVAEAEGKIVGGIWYIESAVETADRLEKVITFGPLAIRPDYQNLGIGKMLLEKTIPIAREMGYRGIIILGEPDYYPQHGFLTCDHFGITTEDGKNFPAFMGMELAENGLCSIPGRFIEPPVCTDLPEEQLNAYDRLFPSLQKKRQTGQWS